MSADNYIPIYLKLHERKGPSLDQLISDVDSLSKDCALEPDVSLAQILTSEKNPSLLMLVYQLKTKPSRQRHSAAVGIFLDKLFSQFAEKHPSFIEPLTLSEPEVK